MLIRLSESRILQLCPQTYSTFGNIKGDELSGSLDRVTGEVAVVYLRLHLRKPSGVPTAYRSERANLLSVSQASSLEALQLDDPSQCSIEKLGKVMSANQPPSCDVENRLARTLENFLIGCPRHYSTQSFKVRNHGLRIRCL